MSDDEYENENIGREEERLIYELYYLIVRTILDKGVIKYSEIRQIYQLNSRTDRSVRFRTLGQVMKTVNDNLLHFQGWHAVLNEDRLTYLNVTEEESLGEKAPNEPERFIGLLKTTLMYVFMASKPGSKHPGVPHDELMTFLEASISRDPDGKLHQSELDKLRKLVAPSPRAEFVKKGYLTMRKTVNENDEDVIRYEWGPTALQTIDPTELVQLFVKVTGASATQFAEQAERALELKKQQMEAVEKAGVPSLKRSKE